MESLGDMYLIANEITIGLGEKEIIGRPGQDRAPLAGVRAQAREELMERRGWTWRTGSSGPGAS